MYSTYCIYIGCVAGVIVQYCNVQNIYPCTQYVQCPHLVCMYVQYICRLCGVSWSVQYTYIMYRVPTHTVCALCFINYVLVQYNCEVDIAFLSHIV